MTAVAQAFTRMMAGMAECELCDMDLSYCEHGLAQTPPVGECRRTAPADLPEQGGALSGVLP